jgi:hypothetical protein
MDLAHRHRVAAVAHQLLELTLPCQLAEQAERELPTASQTYPQLDQAAVAEAPMVEQQAQAEPVAVVRDRQALMAQQEP